MTVVRIGAVADLHYGRMSDQNVRGLFERAAKVADLLLIGGDLTDFGEPAELELLIRDLPAAGGIPIVAVLGNHDFEAAKEKEIASALRGAGVRILDGDAVEVQGVGVVGAKGFGGGFGRGTLEPWGETAVKNFVHAAIDESLKLERALARLTVPTRVALLHYSPIRETLLGEPEEIFAFLGSGRLEEPLNRYGVAAVFHGHAHHGAPEGRTSTGIPVYNVSLPVLRRASSDATPLRVVEIPIVTEENGAASTAAI